MPLPLHFESPQVRIDNSVWVWLSKEKLNKMKLSTEASIDACQVSWEPFSGSSRLVVSYSEGQSTSDFGAILHNVNTAKDFKEFGRAGMFDELCSSAVEHKQRVYLVTFADLKTYTFTYNVAIPTVSPLDFSFEATGIDVVAADGASQTTSKHMVLSSEGVERDFEYSDVREGDSLVVRETELTTEGINLPFYMRTVLTRVCACLKRECSVSLHYVKRDGSRVNFSNVGLKPISACRPVPGWVRWSTPSGSFTTIQSVDLKRFLDPETVAKEAVNLNVKLIKWRLIPQLEPERMSGKKFLLLGAGTLGCAIARCLLAWGVGEITFVDSGRVSYSNPARQWLFTLEDAVAVAPKAETAAKRLKQILPSVNAVGIDFQIPLPGHADDLNSLDSSLGVLTDLIAAHDVVFMLTDSRESRWLPTLLVASHTDKLGISVALGFDSYLVKVQSFNTAQSACYFCNDVSAPADSTAFRTLDQQCTVTRPGLAATAACMAVELVATMSQSSGFGAPRSVEDRDSLLGATPDQIRGFLSSFTSFPAVTEPALNCICCGAEVVRAFRDRGVEMVREVVRDASRLMDISGLARAQQNVDQQNLADFQFSDDDQ